MRALALAMCVLCGGGGEYRVRSAHPRILVPSTAVLRQRCAGPLADDYAAVKRSADRAVTRGRIVGLDRPWHAPVELLNCALAWLVERDRRYVAPIVQAWEAGGLVPPPGPCHFGFHAIAFDWIHDALTATQRRRFGGILGAWLRWFTDTPAITLKWGYWGYNQTWGPAHLNVMNARDAIAPKLFVALAILGAGTPHEVDARSFLDSWHRRVGPECLPAFDRMGGVWSESYGHGAYGPAVVIPWALRAWQTATGIDLAARLRPWGFPREAARWVAWTMMPHNERTAWIDDGGGQRPTAFARAAPMLGGGLARWFADRGRDWGAEPWTRVASLDPGVTPAAPSSLPLAYCFRQAGHVYMRSAWDDPNATWAFFGAGPQFAAHSRDDEGHFLICKRGALVSRQGGQGHNDDDYYAAGSLIYNILTIFDPDEKMRRVRGNENDGGLQRHVYRGGPWPRARGGLVAYEHRDGYTYAAADLTKAYAAHKVRTVTRQFVFLRGARECFVVFDRVTATRPAFRRHFFLHLPDEPVAAGRAWTWLSAPQADGDTAVASTGRSRMRLHTLLPRGAGVTVRGGPGREAWGHPLEPSAQYEHASTKRLRPPRCPWRIEVADRGSGARTLFLHVLEIQDAGAAKPLAVRFVPPAGVDVGGRKIRFRVDGPPGGTVDGRPLATGVRVEGQYE